MNTCIGDLEGKNSVTEDDEALEEERKKNLEILQSVLSSSQQTCSRTASKAKTFRSDTHTHTCAAGPQALLNWKILYSVAQK